MLRHAVIEVDASSVKVHPVISDELKNDLIQTWKMLQHFIRNLPSCRKTHMPRCADTVVSQSSRTRASHSSGEVLCPLFRACTAAASRSISVAYAVNRGGTRRTSRIH